MASITASTALLKDVRRRNDHRAWKAFCTRYEPVLLAVALRSGLQEQDARDVVQETLLVFLKRFTCGEYRRSRGRVSAWLRGIAINKIHEFVRRRKRAGMQLPDGNAYMDRIPDEHTFADVFEQEWERRVVATCMDMLREEVEPKTFGIFELYAVENWPATKVAAHFQVTNNTVYITKTRLIARLQELQRKLRDVW